MAIYYILIINLNVLIPATIIFLYGSFFVHNKYLKRSFTSKRWHTVDFAYCISVCCICLNTNTSISKIHLIVL